MSEVEEKMVGEGGSYSIYSQVEVEKESEGEPDGKLLFQCFQCKELNYT